MFNTSLKGKFHLKREIDNTLLPRCIFKPYNRTCFLSIYLLAEVTIEYSRCRCCPYTISVKL